MNEKTALVGKVTCSNKKLVDKDVCFLSKNHRTYPLSPPLVEKDRFSKSFCGKVLFICGQVLLKRGQVLLGKKTYWKLFSGIVISFFPSFFKKVKKIPQYCGFCHSEHTLYGVSNIFDYIFLNVYIKLSMKGVYN